MRRKGTHFAPETYEEKRERKKKEKIATYSAYTISILIILSIAIFSFVMSLRSCSKLIESTPDEISTEPMTMGVMLWTDDGFVDITPTAAPTSTSTTPTIISTEHPTIKPTNNIIETQNDEIEINNDQVSNEVGDKPEETDSVNNETRQYLLDIDNPDYTYDPMVIHLQDDDRVLAAKIIMNEFGDGGFEACCLQAQALRDAMIYSRSSLEQIYHFFQYDKYPLLKIPNQDCYNAIDYIFESGELAVPHRVLVMYNPQHAKSDWHESQNFVIEYQGVRYFDM